MYWVYIVQSVSSGKRYIGQTNNMGRRLEEHNTRSGRYTSNKGPWEIVYHEKFDTRSEAMKKEKFLKSGKGRELLKKILAS